MIQKAPKGCNFAFKYATSDGKDPVKNIVQRSLTPADYERWPHQNIG